MLKVDKHSTIFCCNVPIYVFFDNVQNTLSQKNKDVAHQNIANPANSIDSPRGKYKTAK